MAKPDPVDLSSLLQSRQQRRNSAQERSPSPTETSPPPAKVGRPPGRRSNPEVAPLNLLVEEDLVTEVRYRLRKLNKGKPPKDKLSLSDLVETLLQDWLDKRL